jgi:hypothetical protein
VGGWRNFEWPARLGLVPAGDHADRSFAVRAQALDGDGDLYVWQQVVASFTRGRTTLLAMSLIDECTVAALECGNASCVGTAGCKTCRAGDCVDVELLASLPDYDPDATGSLFDGSVPVDTDGGRIDGGDGGGPDAPIDGGDAEPPPDSGPPSDGGDAQAGDADVPDAGDGSTTPPFTVVESTPSVAAPVLDDTRGALSVTFSAPVDGATITPSRFKVVHAGAPVAGVIATSERGATFTPDSPWVLAGSYTLSLNASIEDATGRPLQTFELGFTVRDGVWSRLAVFDAIHNPVVALSRDGHGVLQWPRTIATSGGIEILVSRYTPGSPWSSPVQLSPAGASVSVAAINNRQHAVAVWSGISAGQTASVYTGTDWTAGPFVSPGSYPDVFLSESDELFFVVSDAMNNNALDGYRFTLGAASPAEIPLAPTTNYNTHAQLAVVGSTAALMWQHLDTGTSISSVNVGTFDTLDTPQISTPGADATLPQVAVNAPQTSAMAVWLEATSAAPTLTRVWAARLTTTWSTPVVISQGTAAAQRPVVAVDDQGRALAAWTQDGAIIGARFEPATGWGAAAPISAGGVVGHETPRIALAPNGNGIATWAQDSPGMTINEIWAARFIAGRGWQASARGRISDVEAGASDTTSLAMDDAGRALVAWYQSNKVWVARFE